MSRHRKIKSSRSRAAVIAAAGALSVATAASATAATWSPSSPQAREPQGHAARAPHLTVTGQLARPVSEAARQDSSATLAQNKYRLRLVQAQAAIARRQAAKKRAAERAARKAAAAARQAQEAQDAAPPGQAASVAPAASGSPRQIAQAMLGSFGWPASEFSCLDPLWARESGWSVSAYNAGSGAFGIPQALPGSKMASAGPDWRTNPATQIKWGLEYIKSTYGSPCTAWAHAQATGWY